MNKPHLRHYDGPVVSFSHFLHRRPSHGAAGLHAANGRHRRAAFRTDAGRCRRDERLGGAAQLAGCAALDEQIRALKSGVNVFGHSHIRCDRVIDGVRYIQNPLRYPRERDHLSPAGRMLENRLLSGALYPLSPQ